MGGSLILIEDVLPESREEFRYQAREGFTVDRARARRSVSSARAAEPLVLTMPKIHELDPMKRVRYAADAAVVWLFFFLAWSAFYLASQAQAEALGAQRRARRRGKRGASGTGPGAPLPGQPALPVQYA